MDNRKCVATPETMLLQIHLNVLVPDRILINLPFIKYRPLTTISILECNSFQASFYRPKTSK